MKPLALSMEGVAHSSLATPSDRSSNSSSLSFSSDCTRPSKRPSTADTLRSWFQEGTPEVVSEIGYGGEVSPGMASGRIYASLKQPAAADKLDVMMPFETM